MDLKWIKLESTTSTNTYLADLLKKGKVKMNTAVTTDYQIDGRGQGSHSWHSDPGKNLLMSLLLFPAFLSASQQFQLSKIASVAICDILILENIDPMIKWPNDILTLRGKIAGILIEHGILGGSISHTIMGIGLNLNQTSFPRFPVRATSLALEKQVNTDPRKMAESLTEKILTRYEQLKSGEVATLEHAYMERFYKFGQPVLFITGGIELQGIIRGVNDFGELLIETEGEIRSYGHQEISLKA